MAGYLLEALTLCCPKCNTPSDRLDGCAHIKCSHCDAQYCWCCFRSFEGEDGVYRHLRGVHWDYYPPKSQVAHFHRNRRAEQLLWVLWNHRVTFWSYGETEREDGTEGAARLHFLDLVAQKMEHSVPKLFRLLPVRMIRKGLAEFLRSANPVFVGHEYDAEGVRIVRWRDWELYSRPKRKRAMSVVVGTFVCFVMEYGWAVGCEEWSRARKETLRVFGDLVKGGRIDVELWQEGCFAWPRKQAISQ